MTPEEVRDLALRASENNQKLGITGILVTSGQLFYQVIEGPKAHINELFHAIQHDARHRDVLQLEIEEDIAERFFPDWSMRQMNLDEHAEERLQPVRELLGTIIQKRQELQRLTLSLERALWLELASLS
jgi:chromosome condensin MukBEF complex kleisin-like MukF subunit